MYCDVTEHVVTTACSPPGEDAIPAETATMTCIALPHELIFIDCGVIPKVASKFRSDMEERFQRKTSHLLFTHTHWDHIFGMEAFEDVTIGSSTVGVQYLKRNLTRSCSKEKREQAAKRYASKKEIADSCNHATLFLPHVGVKEELLIGPDDNIIFRVIGGHSKDSACCYIPAEKVLVAGDNLLTCYAQLPGNPVKTVEIFDYWETLDIESIIPGHGGAVGKEFMTHLRVYFHELLSILKVLKAQQLSVKDVLDHPDLPHYFGKDLPDWREKSVYHAQWLEMNIKSWYRWLGSAVKG